MRACPTTLNFDSSGVSITSIWSGTTVPNSVITGITIRGAELVTEETHEITNSTSIADLVVLREGAVLDRTRAQAVLDADGTAKGILLTEREKSHLGDVVKFRDAEIAQIDSVITTFETKHGRQQAGGFGI